MIDHDGRCVLFWWHAPVVRQEDLTVWRDQTTSSFNHVSNLPHILLATANVYLVEGKGYVSRWRLGGDALNKFLRRSRRFITAIKNEREVKCSFISALVHPSYHWAVPKRSNARPLAVHVNLRWQLSATCEWMGSSNFRRQYSRQFQVSLPQLTWQSSDDVQCCCVWVCGVGSRWLFVVLLAVVYFNHILPCILLGVDHGHHWWCWTMWHVDRLHSQAACHIISSYWNSVPQVHQIATKTCIKQQERSTWHCWPRVKYRCLGNAGSSGDKHLQQRSLGHGVSHAHSKQWSYNITKMIARGKPRNTISSFTSRWCHRCHSCRRRHWRLWWRRGCSHCLDWDESTKPEPR